MCATCPRRTLWSSVRAKRADVRSTCWCYCVLSMNSETNECETNTVGRAVCRSSGRQISFALWVTRGFSVGKSFQKILRFCAWILHMDFSRGFFEWIMSNVLRRWIEFGSTKNSDRSQQRAALTNSSPWTFSKAARNYFIGLLATSFTNFQLSNCLIPVMDRWCNTPRNEGSRADAMVDFEARENRLIGRRQSHCTPLRTSSK